MDQALAALKTYFGYDSFRQGQEEAVDALLAGRDLLAVMPTGAGKSVCFQVPALLLPGITLVVSPLISLMKDQVAALGQAGISAAYLNSALTPRQFELALENARCGKYKLLYVAPERLSTQAMADFAAHMDIALVAVDEAHCVSQWGQDFRPSYLDIPAFVNSLPRRPAVAAFTATATEAVREDMARLLELRDPAAVMTGFDRKNLFYEVRRVRRRTEEVLRLVQGAPGESGIIYCSTRKTVEQVCALLQKNDLPATRYHAGLTAGERRENQEDFTYDRRPIMVATNAFGMGIDKSNVRYIIHCNMPKDMESYYQEAGRAGRDGEPARCTLLYSPQDLMTARMLIDGDRDSQTEDPALAAALREKAYERLGRMNEYARTEACLRRNILSYFGESAPQTCACCANCQKTFQEIDITVDAQKILSCVKRTGAKFGAALIVQILRGRETKRILDWGLHHQTTFGLMKDLKTAQVRERVEALVQRECLTEVEHQSPTGLHYATLALGPKAGGVLFRGEKVTMRLSPEEKKRRRTAAAPDTAQAPEGLFDRLRALRTVLARAQGVPAYVVFSDATLQDMCAKCPTDEAGLLEVSGVGQKKLQQYGAAFLEELRAFSGQGE